MPTPACAAQREPSEMQKHQRGRRRVLPLADRQTISKEESGLKNRMRSSGTLRAQARASAFRNPPSSLCSRSSSIRAPVAVRQHLRTRRLQVRFLPGASIQTACCSPRTAERPVSETVSLGGAIPLTPTISLSCNSTAGGRASVTELIDLSGLMRPLGIAIPVT